MSALNSRIELEERVKSDYFPLSYIQKDLWTIQNLYPNNFAYNILFSTHITNKVNLDALKKFFQILIDKHEILRSNFVCQNNSLSQIITVQEIDFRNIDASKWSLAEIRSASIKAYQTPFNLEKDRLIKILCFSKDPQNTVVIGILHHIIMDGWSASIIIKELDQLFPQISVGLPVVVNKLPKSYSDFVNWQDRFIHSEEAEFQLSYWKNLMNSEIPYLNLAQKSRLKQTSKLKGKTLFFKLKKELLDKIKNQFPDISLNTFFLSIFHILLHRYSDSDVIVSCSPRFSRLRTTFGLNRADFKDNIRLFCKYDF